MQLDHFCSHWSIKLTMKFFAPIMRYAKRGGRGRLGYLVGLFNVKWGRGSKITVVLRNYKMYVPLLFSFSVVHGVNLIRIKVVSQFF